MNRNDKNGTPNKRTPRGPKPKLGHDPVHKVSLADICPAPENDDLYGVIDPQDPEIVALAYSIKQHGLREPIVVTNDGYILSGHRRYAACKLAKLEHVPVRYENLRRSDDIDEFVLLLREYNRQRDKSLDVKLREELINANPEESYRALAEYRILQSIVEPDGFEIEGQLKRCEISLAKQPLLEAIQKVLEERRAFWPLSDRAIHYALLNSPPLKHASKSDSLYDNTKQSYRALVDILTRARLTGEVPFEAIADATRPVTTWDVYPDPRRFIRKQIDRFLKGYYRDLMSSQPNHIEIVCEKNTVEPILRSVAEEYTIPLTSGRGYCSLPPRHDMALRFKRSGKEQLILLIVSDLDPDGDQIAHTFARSLRDDFGIWDLLPIKVALTRQQAEEFELPCGGTAKKGSANYRRFVDEHGGDTVYELEALDPSVLQQVLRDAIDSVIDVDLYNAEVDAEANDAAFLDGVRETTHEALKSMKWEGES